MYYQLTDEDKDIIKKHFDNSDMENLLLYISAVGSVGMIRGWQYAQKVAEEHGIEALSLGGCGACKKSCDKDECKED